MKTVILAAGIGSRIKSLTCDKPKSMLKIMKKTLIYYTVSSLVKNDITEIYIVVGYQHEKLINYLKTSFPEITFNFIINTDYDKKENIYSLYLSLPYIQGEDILIMNSDLFCDEEIVRKAIVTPSDMMVVDRDAEYTMEATKVKLDANGWISAIGKDLPPDESAGEYIGILKLQKGSADLYFGQITQMIQNGQDQIWYPYALRQILPEIKIKPFFTGKLLWEEIDSASDYERAFQKAKELEIHSIDQG